MDLYIVLIIVCFIFVVYFLLRRNQIKSQVSLIVSLKFIDGFYPSQDLSDPWGTCGIGVDEMQKKVCLVRKNRNIRGGFEHRIFDYRDLLAVEIFEDGETVTRTLRTSQIGGAIIGGLTLGVVGSILGGLSGKQQSSQKVKKIDLRVIVNDISDPTFDINILDRSFDPCKRGDFAYEQAMCKARHWEGILRILIREADLKDNETVENDYEKINKDSPTSVGASVADEILKLAQLRDAGTLSETEFKKLKVRLLRS